MSIGLVLGKFMPLHEGHIALINFAAEQCDKVIVLVCHDPETQSMDGEMRHRWVGKTFRLNKKIQVEYIDTPMPDAPGSDRSVSKVWATYLSKRFPTVDTIVSSETYGDYLAEYMNIKHIMFDKERKIVPISATMIRNDPYKHWDMISKHAKVIYVKRVCIYGPESCGKSTLTKMLANHFNTEHVPEMARELLTDPTTGLERHCVYEDIEPIADLHARTIIDKARIANKVLFVDSDILTTGIYSEQYFGQIPEFEEWIHQVNVYDIHLLATPNVPWVDDGTRDLGHIREEMYQKFKKALDDKKLPYVMIDGSTWEQRNQQAITAVENLLNESMVR